MRINVKGPDVNESFSAFGVNKDGDIRFGMAAIKGVGLNVVNDIIAARNEGGPFTSIYDFVERVNRGSINRRIIENLALAGAFDCFTELKREDFFETNAKDETFTEQLVKYAQSYQNAKNNQENSLFGDFDDSINTAGRPPVKPAVPWVDSIKLERERELVGMYLSAHPLDPYYIELKYGCMSIKDYIEEGPVEGRELTLGGMVTEYTVRQGNSGNFGILKIEDYSGSTEMRLFGQDFIDYGKYGVIGTPLLIHGRYGRRFRNSDVRFQITGIKLLEEAKGQLVNGITININADKVTENFHGIINDMIKSSTTNRGDLFLRVRDTELNRSVKLASGVKIPITKNLLDTLDEMEMDYEVMRG